MGNDMQTYFEQSSKGRSLIVALFGVFILIVGLFASHVLWKITQYIVIEYLSGQSPYSTITLVYQGLWCLAAISVVIIGISLIVSGYRRKQTDLIPGPTLYVLGLALAGVGGIALMNGFILEAVSLFFIGIVLMVWEWGSHVS